MRSVTVGRGGASASVAPETGVSDSPAVAPDSRVVEVRRPGPTLSTRRRRVRETLAASGVAPVATLPTLDMARLTPAERYFFAEALGAGISNFAGDQWPTEATDLDSSGAVFRDGSSAVFRDDAGAIVLVELHRGWVTVHVAAPDAEQIGPAVAAFRSTLPPAYLAVGEDSRVPITFWTCGNFGATSRLRRIESASWSEIERNYPGDVAAELNDLMSWSKPDRDGQLLLWQGPPGCGKTWALRALASEWASWAEFHYITDPDVFFVERPSYMVDVLLSDSYELIDASDGSVVTESGDKWRVLILEDTGELLAANAKEKYGQGLSRLLNVVDGMIGQGLRVIALITTNDELGDLAPAAVRPGRCVSRQADGAAGPTVFGPLSAAEASVWLGETVEEGGTLAELYARSSGATEAFSDDQPGDAEEAEVAAADAEADDDRGRDFAELLELAREPLDDPSPFGGELAATLRSLSASGNLANGRAVSAALEAVASAHRQTMEAVREVLVGGPSQGSGDALAIAALSALDGFARRPDPAPAPAPDVHVHLPQTDLSVHVDAPEPAKIEPHFVVEAPPPAEIKVDVHPAAVEVPPTQVEVHVPPVEVPAPIVHVAAAEAPKPKAVRVEYDEDGYRHYVVDDGPPG